MVAERIIIRDIVVSIEGEALSEAVARRSGGNVFTGVQALKLELPIVAVPDIGPDTGYTVVGGIQDDDGEWLRGCAVGRFDLTLVGGGSDVYGFLEFERPNGSATDVLVRQIGGSGTDAETTRVAWRVVPWPIKVLDVVLSNDGLVSPFAPDPLIDSDVATRGFVLASIPEIPTAGTPMAATLRLLEEPSDLARFDLCGDADTEGDWGAKVWTTPPPTAFGTGTWIECRGVTFLEAGLPSSPTDGHLVYSEMCSWPMPETETNPYGAWDALEAARVARWSADKGVWEHFLFWEHTSNTEGLTQEDVRIELSDFPVPLGVRIDAIVFYVENSVVIDESVVGRVRILVEVPPDMADVFLSGRCFKRWGQWIGETSTSMIYSPEPWNMGTDFASLTMESMVVRTDGPTGTILASPDAEVAKLAAPGDPFDDGQENTWTPGPSANVIVP